MSGLNFLSNFQNIDSLAILRALGDETELTAAGVSIIEPWQLKKDDGQNIFVKTIIASDLITSIAGLDFQLFDVKYIYRAASSAAAAEPAIVAPAVGGGRWFMTVNPITLNTAIPAAAPPLPNMEYVAILTSPARILSWKSPALLPSTATVDDWNPNNIAEIDLASAGALSAFNADFVGQKVKSLATSAYLPGIVFEAIDQAGNWKASFAENNYYVDGADITGDFTVDNTDGGYRRNVTSTSIITLPDNLQNISFRVAVFDAIAGGAVTVDLAVSGTATINGGTSLTGLSNRNITFQNNNGAWYAI